jgi:hypothetical protein
MNNLSSAISAIFDPLDVGIPEDDAARILNKKPATLRVWRSKGLGPRYRKSGRTVEYTPRFLKEFLESGVRTPEPASVRRERRAVG